jgi:hypothetical protein
MSMKIFFPDWSRVQLERTALKHASAISLAYDRDFDPSQTDRLVVNMLRHEFTDYDDNQSVGRFMKACSEMAVRYPWLSEECERQMLRRRQIDETAEAWGKMAEAQGQREAEERRARSAASAEAIADLHIGQRVRARVRGHERIGTITWIGRRRVEIAFKIASGAERTHRLFASECQI